MNGYIAIYNGKRIEIYADTIYQAQLLAADQFKVKRNKSYKINVALCEKEGKQVIHTAYN